ncbi:hypothetical protein A2160_06185 [Candidatus Beckwithbacteria bacterium RBG_13_42_9]|uniref:Uncharacterized protein n=1 Tax=Candidatus Beckwithbacteria bacterium RBG_13_42_9 TaxID=1797457 RepID=A0A1F5E5R3_9BACT|nr:MAG: hypothetical protein A2160_06185 [Candidatus Beckwithbacteria bacterium RBG_13_42_9]
MNINEAFRKDINPIAAGAAVGVVLVARHAGEPASANLLGHMFMDSIGGGVALTCVQGVIDVYKAATQARMNTETIIELLTPQSQRKR